MHSLLFFSLSFRAMCAARVHLYQGVWNSERVRSRDCGNMRGNLFFFSPLFFCLTRSLSLFFTHGWLPSDTVELLLTLSWSNYVVMETSLAALCIKDKAFFFYFYFWVSVGTVGLVKEGDDTILSEPLTFSHLSFLPFSQAVSHSLSPPITALHSTNQCLPCDPGC